MIYIDYKAFQIPVLTFGQGWLVVDKPAGMSVHNEPGRDLCSVVSSFVKNNLDIQNKIVIDSDFGINPVHRLDRETSGVLLMAVNKDAFQYFSKQFESRQVKKRYVALLHGRWGKTAEKGTWGIWSWPLARSAGGRQNPAGSGPKQKCETRYRVIGHSVHYSMVEIELLTGRKHQIRRHAGLSGHPVVGDIRYGSKRAIAFLKKLGFERLALHSKMLSIRLSDEDDFKTFEAKIPEQIKTLFDMDCAGHET